MSPFSNTPSPPEIERELDAGERLLWTGRPNAARWRNRAFRMWPFAFLMTAFMLFWLWGATAHARSEWQKGRTPPFTSVAFPAFGLFMLYPAGLLWLGPWLEAARARRTFYAVTDNRALIVTTGRKASVQSVSPAQMQIERRDYFGGEGDLILMRVVKGSGEDEKTVETGFLAIPNPREVEQLIRQNLKI